MDDCSVLYAWVVIHATERRNLRLLGMVRTKSLVAKGAGEFGEIGAKYKRH